MKLALLRHGITDWNLEKRIQGQIDIPLSDVAIKQFEGKSIPRAIVHYRWYCSPLSRARQSAELLGLRDYRVEAALMEMNWGDWEGEILKPLRRQLGQSMRENEQRGLDFCPPNGESPRQIQQRLQPWLNGLSGRDSAAVVHKGIIRCIYAMAFDWDMRGDAPLRFDWDAIHVFQLDRQGRLLPEYQAIEFDRG